MRLAAARNSQLRAAESGGGGGAQTMEEMMSESGPDPTIFATSFKRKRFYMLTRRVGAPFPHLALHAHACVSCCFLYYKL